VSNQRGDVAVAWTSTDSGGTTSLFVARAPAGEAFSPPRRLVEAPAHLYLELLSDLVITGSGDVAVLAEPVTSYARADELHLWPEGDELEEPTDVAPRTTELITDESGRLLVLEEDRLDWSMREWSSRSGWSAWPALGLGGRFVAAAASGDRLHATVFRAQAEGVTAGVDVVEVDLATREVLNRRSVPATDHHTAAKPFAGPGGHVALTSFEYANVVASAAAPGGPFSPPLELHARRLVHGSDAAVAADGTVAVWWGGMEWIDTYADVLLAMGPAGGAIRAVDPPPLREVGASDAKVPMAFDAGSRLLALGQRTSHDGHLLSAGRVAVAMRQDGRWCPAEIVTEDGYDSDAAALAFDGLGGGIAAWRDAKSGEVRVSRYRARPACPPPPPPDPDPDGRDAIMREWAREDARRRAAGLPSVMPARPATPPAEFTLTRAATVGATGRFAFRFRCLLATTCRGRLALRRGAGTWATSQLRVPAARTRRVVVRLGPAARRQVKRTGTLRVTAVVQLGGRPPARTPLTLRRAR
jgi:hypothetical protein